ncbi:MAG TPA: aldo/keto reductase [Thermoanaerobaculia bacterium]|nr:aldo/keto reductase [Thermoanaerobaculia bacterium]
MDLPLFLYGTAWKEDATERLVRLAIENGFRGIDTANQRRHYFEAGVGEAIAGAIRDGIVRRDELFLQTKFTYADSQDDRLPYDANGDPATQVRQSFSSSLEHLRTDTIDSFVLHGPSIDRGLADVDWQVWRAMESLPVRSLGISNVTLDQLRELCDGAKVQPHFVQNRCFARTHWDREVRAFCRERGITYQGFSLLTANVRDLQHSAFWEIVDEHERTPAQVVFRFAIGAGILPLTGTTNGEHMRQDVDVFDFELTPDQIAVIENIAFMR